MRDFIWIPTKSSIQFRCNQILDQVAEAHGLYPSALFKPRRVMAIVRARQEAMYRLRSELDMSLTQIGRLFGGMHHTTVLHAIRKHAERSALRLAA